MSARALTIDTQFIAAGDQIPVVGVAGAPPTNATGGGNLLAIVRAAADAWEALIHDDHQYTLTYGWADTSSLSNAAYHVTGIAEGSPLRPTTGVIAFNNADTANSQMFLDPTPSMNEEFDFVRREFLDLGAGPIETARQFQAVDPLARGRIDLYTTAMHEIGHALGLTYWIDYQLETLDGQIDITLDPFAGAEIDVVGSHIDLPRALLSSSRGYGERREITQTDLLAVCQTSHFGQCDLSLAPAHFAGDLNGDGVTNAADYTLWRDAQSSSGRSATTGESLANYGLWSDNFGRTFQKPETFEGDYNSDGVITFADYTAYINALPMGDLRADGNGDGAVDSEDFDVWASRYGLRVAASSSVSNRPVPEPTSVAVLALVVVTVGFAPSSRVRRGRV